MVPRVEGKLSKRIPYHLAVIMDGNGRWAQQRALPQAVGHRQGAETLRRVVIASRDLGIRYLTAFVFSTENWRRPRQEVATLMELLRVYLTNRVHELNENNVKLRVIGERSALAPDITQLIADAEARTAGNTDLCLTLAVNYGGRQEILNGVRRFAEQVRRGTLTPSNLNEDLFEEYLYTWDLPDPDLVIRTGREHRLSNFLLWQVAYSEFIFLDTLWPDFSPLDLDAAIAEFGRRKRRFGGSRGVEEAERTEPDMMDL